MQKLKERWGPRICSTIPLGVWHKITGIGLVIPHWHVVSDFELTHVSRLYQFRNIRQFKADLEFFLRYYSPVTEQDVICYLQNSRSLPSRSVLFTFDDGFREIYDVVAPLLRAKGVPALFFLITSAIDNQNLCDPQKKSLLLAALAGRQSAATLDEATRLLSLAGVPTNSDLSSRIRAISFHQRHVLDNLGVILKCDFHEYLNSQKPYLTSEQVQTLIHQGFTVGAHSVDHAPYAELSLNAQLFQTRQSMHFLSERFHIKCRSFAFPFRDNGVSLNFYRTIFKEGDLKVSFGTGGIVRHFFPYNLQRFSMERTDLTVAEILASQFVRSLMPRKLRHFLT